MAKKRLNSRRRRKQKNRRDDTKEVMLEAGASYPEFPWNIISYQILPRLPAKSLMRFKSVGMSWKSLIDSDSFAAEYTNFPHSKKRNPTNFLFFYCREQALYTSQIDQQGNPTHLTPLSIELPVRLIGPNLQSINGLICASMIWFHGYSSAGCVFNPTTKECVKFPVSRTPSTCCPHYYFGFNHLQNEYKVLEVSCIYRDHLSADKEHLKFNIFTLHKDSSWRQLDVDVHHLPFDHQTFKFWESVCLHGAIHWMPHEDNVIVVFDVANEKFRIIPMPEGSVGTPSCSTYVGMVDIDGCVAVYGYGDNNSYAARLLPKRTLVLWILKDYENHKWVDEIIVMPKSHIGIDWGFHILCVIHTGELAIMESTEAKSNPPTLWLYNMMSKKIRKESFNLLGTFKHKFYKNWRMGDFTLKTSYENTIVRF